MVLPPKESAARDGPPVFLRCSVRVRVTDQVVPLVAVCEGETFGACKVADDAVECVAVSFKKVIEESGKH